MKYFFYFQKEDYILSDRTVKGITNLSQFTNFFIDEFDNVAFYTYYNLKGNERLDQISFQIYGDQKYYWTIPLINPEITNIWRDLSLEYNTLEKKLKRIYPNKSFMIDSSEDISNKFRINELIDVQINGTIRESFSGRIINIFPSRGYLEIGEIEEDEFNIISSVGELTVIGKLTNDQVKVNRIIESFRSPLYYIIRTNGEDGIENIHYTTYKNSNASAYTILDEEMEKNEKKSRIRVIKKEYIAEIAKSFFQKMKS